MIWVLAIAMVGTFAYTYWKMQGLGGMKRPEWDSTPTAEDGRAIPVVFGTATIKDPNICYFGGARRDGSDYYADALFGLCHGRIDRMSHIFVGGKEIWSGQVAATDYKTIWCNFPDGDGIGGFMRVRMGEVSSAVDDGSTDDGYITDNYLARRMGMTDNKGPRYHGVANVELRDFYMGNTPYVKPLGFRVQRIHYAANGATQWYNGKAEIRIGRDRIDTWKYKVQAVADNTDYSGVLVDDLTWDTGPGGVGNAPNNEGTPRDPAFQPDSQWSYGYKTPPVRTSIKGVLGLSGFDDGIHSWRTPGMKVWLRWDLGRMPANKTGVRIWHDGTARLWWNGVEQTVYPIESSSDSEYYKFNSYVSIPASSIGETENIVALKVTAGSGSCEQGSFVYAGLQIGPGAPTQTAATVDMNPAHIIRECLTDPVWGLGHASGDIGDWESVADTLYNERLGVSTVLKDQTPIVDFIAEILRHINGVLYVDRHTGKFELKLIRQDYTLANLLTLDYSNVITVEDATRRTPAEMVNAVTVTYTNAPNGDPGSITVHDHGLIAEQGGQVSEKIDLPGLSNFYSAQLAAWRNLRVLSAPLLTCSLRCNREAAMLNVGDAVILDWAQLYIDELVMRVVEIDTGDGINNTVRLKLMEDAFDTPDKPLVTHGGISWPTVALGPLPGSVSSTDYVTALEIDPLNGGGVACVFAVSGEASTWSGFTSTEGGVMTADATGQLPASYFDGVDPDAENHAGSWMVGQVVLAYKHGSLADNEHAGPYVCEDIGCRWEEVGSPPAWVKVATNARFRRVGRFSDGAAFRQGLTFWAYQGTVYGDQYLVLDNDGVVLGVTAQTYTAGASHSYTDVTNLLSRADLKTATVSLDATDMQAATIDGANVFPVTFETKSALSLKSIPAGPWRFKIEAAWLTADAAGADNAIGFSVWAVKGEDSRQLFESIGPEMHNTTAAPLSWEYSAPAYTLTEDESLGLVFTCHTSNATPVQFNLRFNSSSHGTGFTVPQSLPEKLPGIDVFYGVPPTTTVGSGSTGITRHIYGGTRNPASTSFTGGTIVSPVATGAISVTIPAGSTVTGISTPTPADGDLLILTVYGATNENPIVFQHMATVTSPKKAVFLSSTAGMGADYSEGLYLFATRARLMLSYNGNEGNWQLLPGGAIA